MNDINNKNIEGNKEKSDLLIKSNNLKLAFEIKNIILSKEKSNIESILLKSDLLF